VLDATPLETALVALARKSCEAPRALAPADLDRVRDLAGEGAVEYAAVIAGFHFINRVADLLEVAPEALPAPLRRVEPLRRLVVRVAGRMFRAIDLRNRDYPLGFDAAVAELAAQVGQRSEHLSAALAPLRAHPQLVEVVARAREERDQRSSIERDVLARVHAVVEAALPASAADVEGLHARPADPVEAFAFVGTRYAHRTTRAMIDALHGRGYDDLGVLDLAIAVADANQWARLSRLLDLPSELLSMADVESAGAAAGKAGGLFAGA
jgi:alkylhydroperoxidase family enzyme